MSPGQKLLCVCVTDHMSSNSLIPGEWYTFEKYHDIREEWVAVEEDQFWTFFPY